MIFYGSPFNGFVCKKARLSKDINYCFNCEWLKKKVTKDNVLCFCDMVGAY